MTRSANFPPDFLPNTKRVNPKSATIDQWIDRARLFQVAVSKVNPDDYGTVDSSINDVPRGSLAPDKPSNYCERQGRCILGCLPGARHTLNKQLMRAIYGSNGVPPFKNFEVHALSEVRQIQVLASKKFQVDYIVRHEDHPASFDDASVEAGVVIVAAGCLGTNEILLRSTETLPGLSGRLGNGFSANGDYLAFLDKTTDRVSLTRGPVTTSFAQFNRSGKNKMFHTIEDNGIPRLFSYVVSGGVTLLRNVLSGKFQEAVDFVIKQLQIPTPQGTNTKHLESEDEVTSNMMCVAAMGLDKAAGQFSLDGDKLRLKSIDQNAFANDPIYDEIRTSLKSIAEQLTKDSNEQFVDPLLDLGKSRTVATSHPLGGCSMGKDIQHGVVNEYGRVFCANSFTGYYDGLYVADASMIPTALGVNPSLTIAALALRVADDILKWLNIR